MILSIMSFEQNDIQQNVTTLSIMTLRIMALSTTTLSITKLSIMTFGITINEWQHSAKWHDTDCYFAECHLCWVSFMLSVANTSFMLSVIMKA